MDMPKVGSKSWGEKGIQKHPYIMGDLESKVHAQGRTNAQKTPEKTLSFHLRLISRLSTNRK